jgi:hypothetical protein
MMDHKPPSYPATSVETRKKGRESVEETMTRTTTTTTTMTTMMTTTIMTTTTTKRKGRRKTKETKVKGRISGGGEGGEGEKRRSRAVVVKLQSSEGEKFVVEDSVVEMCTTVKHLLRGGRHSFSNALGGQFCIEGSHAILKKEGRVLATLLTTNSNNNKQLEEISEEGAREDGAQEVEEQEEQEEQEEEEEEEEEEEVIVLREVKTWILEKVLEYCRYHHQNDSKLTEKQKRLWDTNFLNLKTNSLCELASVRCRLSHSLTHSFPHSHSHSHSHSVSLTHVLLVLHHVLLVCCGCGQRRRTIWTSSH